MHKRTNPAVTLFCFLFLGTPGSALAHPVAFAGATAVQFFSDNQMREAQVYYSPSARVSVGGRYLNLDLAGRKSDVLVAGANFLAKRWNAADSQANLYLGAAAGGERRQGSSAFGALRPTKTNPVALFELDSDWESREFYVSAQARAVPSSGTKPLYSGYTRFGFSPYVAEYGSLHTWIILEVSRMSHSGMKTEVTPLIRLFQKNVLFEIGRSLENDWKFNFMVHL